MNRRSSRSPDHAQDLKLDQAARWVAGLSGGQLNADDRRRFTDWLDADPDNARAFDRMASLWGRLEVVKGLPLPDADPVQRGRSAWIIAPIAACLVLALAVTVIFTGPERYATEIGGRETVMLDDGSRVTLNTDTELDVSFSDTARTVKLRRGEGYFEVESDAARPFVVSTSHGRVEAVGTAFGVLHLSDRSKVMVGEGRVAIHLAGLSESPVSVLERNEALEFDASAILSDRSVDVAAATAWRQDRLVYDGVTLEEMITDLNRYMPRKMVVSDPELAQTRVSAVLHIEEQQATLNALARILPLHWTELSDELILLQPDG